MKQGRFFSFSNRGCFLIGLISVVALLCSCASSIESTSGDGPDKSDGPYTQPSVIMLPEKYAPPWEKIDFVKWATVLKNTSSDGSTFPTLWFHPSKGCTDIYCVAEEHHHYCPEKCKDPTHDHF